jgi:D-xylose 1-dehydrogenase (NADP+, D-xylono-1,5-lactone-forming)
VAVAWGVLSTARINRLVLAGARKSDRVDIVAVASRTPESAKAYAGEHGIERAYGSYEALLEDDEVEAVYISLPNSMHVDWSVRALEAGKHVLCEKPLTRRAAEAEHAFDVAERTGRVLMEAFMYRHHPQTHRLQSLVAEGAIGRLRSIRSAFTFTVDNRNNIRLLAELDGGALMDVGCYCVNGSRMLAGEPTDLDGEQVVGDGGVDVRFSGTMRFDGGVIARFDCGLDLPFRDELEVTGSDGTLFLDDPWHCRMPVLELRRSAIRGDGAAERIEIETADSYQLELENLSDAIRGEATSLLGRDDAVGQARAIEQLYRSAES